MLDTALELLKTQDSFAAIEYLDSLPNPADVMQAYVDIVRHFYWQEKNLSRVIVFAQAGIQYGLSLAIAVEQRYQHTIAGLLANISMSESVSERDSALVTDFNALIAQYERPIFILIYQMVQDQDEAADLTQETFLTAYKARHEFTGDIPLYLWLCKIALNHCLTRNSKMKLQLRSAAKGLAYDLASFTWLGWDEPGIAIDAEHLAIGLDAAKTNLRLAHELQKGNLPLTRAYWMLGAQYLANGSVDLARMNFDEAIVYAKNEGAIGEELLAAGFAQLTQLLAAPSDPNAGAELEAIKTKLADVENGPEFVQQIETAQRVFSK